MPAGLSFDLTERTGLTVIDSVARAVGFGQTRAKRSAREQRALPREAQMKITAIHAVPVNIPMTSPAIKTAVVREPPAFVQAVVVRIVTDTEHVGTAEVAVVPQGWGETQGTVVSIIKEFLEPAILGSDPRDTERIVWAMSPPRGVADNVIAKSAVDIALHDLVARALGVPLYKLVGGWSDPPTVRLSWMFGILPPEEVLSEARAKVAEGFRAFKIKVGLDRGRDVETVRLLRQELGPDVLLYVDANGGWSPSDAVYAVNRMAEHGLAWVEDPFPRQLPLKLRKQAAAGMTAPILSDFPCQTAGDALSELDAGLAQIVGIKFQRSGFREARKIATLAESFGSNVILSVMAESYLGTLAAAHFAAGIRNVQQPCEISAALRSRQYLLPGHPVIEQAAITLSSEASGNGVEIDEETLAHFAGGPLPW